MMKVEIGVPPLWKRNDHREIVYFGKNTRCKVDLTIDKVS